MGTFRRTVCVIGAGSAGMGAVYAFIESAKKGAIKNDCEIEVILVEPYEKLGGTAVNGWVQTWIEGINPPYLEDIFRRLKVSGDHLNDSVLPSKYRNDGTKSLNLEIHEEDLAGIYKADVEAYSDFKSNLKITWKRGFKFKSAGRVETLEDGRRRVKSIDIVNGNMIESLSADYFIDSSGDGVLCRSVAGVENRDYYVGEDPFERFGEELMNPDKKKVRGHDPKSLNEPSFFYRVLSPDKQEDDTELLSKFEVKVNGKKVDSPSYIDTTGYLNNLFVNPMTGLGHTGYETLDNIDKIYNESRDLRQYEHWKVVKTVLQNEFNRIKGEDPSKSEDEIDKVEFRGYLIKHRNYNHTNTYAPMLGVRETFRINCDYMLRQQDLTNKISSTDLGDNIACGSHTVDLHIKGTIDSESIAYFNDNLIKPSGIPYRCMIPKGTSNVLIACRAYGASHIALSARRVNKDMAQLGWAAGFAIKQCCENQLTSVRRVNVSKVQSESGFISRVLELEKIMN